MVELQTRSVSNRLLWGLGCHWVRTEDAQYFMGFGLQLSEIWQYWDNDGHQNNEEKLKKKKEDIFKKQPGTLLCSNLCNHYQLCKVYSRGNCQSAPLSFYTMLEVIRQSAGQWRIKACLIIINTTYSISNFALWVLKDYYRFYRLQSFWLTLWE